MYAEPQKVVVTYQNSEINAMYEGVAVKFMRQNVKTDKDTTKAAASKLEQFTTMCSCPTCDGKRYNEKCYPRKF